MLLQKIVLIRVDTFIYPITLYLSMEDILYRSNPWWTEDFRAPGIKREDYLSKLYNLKNTKDVVLITGLRRVGKTTLMYQLIELLIKNNIDPKRILYVSLDNIALREYSILDIIDEYRRIHSLKHKDFVYLFLDEVHTKKDYELQLKNLYDMGSSKIYASGSASLDIIMRSPHLTGRQRIIRIYPLNFKEFLRFTGNEISPADSHLYPSLAEDYAKIGGLPEYVKTRDLNYIQSLLDTIIYRDIAGAYGIRNVEKLVDTLAFIAQSVGSPISLRKISRCVGISKDEVSKIIRLFREANLIYTIEREGKISERKISPKKLYLADTGFFTVLVDKINFGAIVENLVYLKLRPCGEVRYYRSSGCEIDFVRGKNAWESKYKDSLTDNDVNKLKNLKGYYSKTIITKTKEERIDSVELIPLWKFLLL